MAPRDPVPVEVLLSQREWVRSLARRLVAGDAEADDLAQQVWVDALRSPPARDAGIRGWFATLLRRRARDAWRGDARRARREEAAAPPAAVRATADVVADAEAHRLVVQAAMDLEEPYRETLLLRFFEDLAPREIAERQGVPVETVRTRIRRALDRLRERLDAGRGRARWMAALLPLAVPGAGGLAQATGGAAATAAAAGGAVMGTKAAVAGGVVVAAGLAVLLGSALLTGEDPPPAPPPAPPPETAAAAVASPEPPRTEPPPRPVPKPAPAAAAAAAPAEPEPEAGTRLLLKGRIRDLEGEGAGGVDVVAWLESSDLVPPPADPGFEEKESEDLRSFYAQVGRDRGRNSVRGRTGSDGTFVLELPSRGTYGLVAFTRRAWIRAEAGTRLRGLGPGSVVHLRALGVRDLRTIVLDGERPAGERIEALGALATLKGERDALVAGAMVRLLPGLEQPTDRETVLRHLAGVRERVLVPAMIERVRTDASPEVRAAAAAVLAANLDDPLAAAVLEEARDGDASEAVRTAATEALDGRWNRR